MAQESNGLLRNLLVIAGIVFLVVLSTAAYRVSSTYSSSNAGTIRISADATVTAVPDIATFNFSVITEGGTDVKALQVENTKKMNDAISYLKAESVKDENVKTSSYNVSPRYENQNCRLDSECPPPTIVGYTVSQRVDVKVEDFEILGGLLEGIVTKGVNDISSLQFTIDDPFSLEVEAKAKAINRAKGKAQDLAKEVGFKLGRVVGIEEGGSRLPYAAPMMESFAMDSRGGAVEKAMLEPGSQEVNVQITLEYEVLN
ncbi:hypothetical protein COV81_01750 [Candidatus Peregrinibacteria bacterium CG11_big_fil_rev_8_21_14_0_20_41_10]|nr:MAG: hypothetical protein COV81_01750 [Candidatus Peregrinibacteria bacterium CG11_big_fil_rev_8_21_14_0_20_41_10]PIZ77228.1 MAG: hypothetical protein COY06_00855 [Candidatus Peregrinibacteria bacterium CG_4_10_14_0_2_um_filter_41_8]PJC37593.1 MAG: hypothetical protein CO045_04750 [Candidatus Peregrinibacteria bacterium CG_4_9_14_0_2_um_filter_41_14]